MYTSPQHLWIVIHLALIVQMTSNLAQGCTITCEIMMFAPCPANFFEIVKKIIQKLKVIGLIPFCEAHVYI